MTRNARLRPGPDAPLGDGFDWLEGERALDWNGPTERPFNRFPQADLDRPIIDLFEQVARRQPGRIAITGGGDPLGFGDLWDGLSGLAETIAARTRPGDLIGLLLPASPLFPLAMLACLAAGRPFVALDPGCPADWLDQVIGDARPTLVIAGPDGPRTSTPTITLAVLPAPASPGWRPTPSQPDEPACVLFTSGSTGRPKGVVNSQRALTQRVAQSINAAHINPQDRLLTLASLCTIVGLRDALTALLAGARLHLVDPQQLGARETLAVIDDQSITILFAFPALLRSVAAVRQGRARDTLRLVRIGGDTTLWSDIDQLRAWLAPDARIQLIYAATEAPMMQWFVSDAFRGDEPRIPIGYPLLGNRLAIVGEDGGPVAQGEAGELVVASPYATLGPWVDGRCAANRIESDEAPPSRLFHTGDLVRQRPDGLLERLGRRDRQVKIRGARVDLDGVEAALRQHPRVRDVGVLARTDAASGAVTLVAHVSAREGAAAGLFDDLRALMRRAPAPMRPGRYHLASDIPRLPSSKLDVRGLAALDAAAAEAERRGADREPVLTRGDALTATVARVWREVLRTPVSGPDDDFLDAGGDSLKAIAFMLELEHALGVELPLTLMHEAPTFGELCQALGSHRAAGYVPLVLLKAGDGAPPVFIVHGLGGSVADLFPVARRMSYGGPVIGIQARGLVAGDPPHATVEAMADEYLAAVRARQPTGPYHLCGYSFGGLVAFEMARRLRDAGDAVGLVGLFDSLTRPIGWRAVVRRAGVRIGEWLRGMVKPASGESPRVPAHLKSAPAGVIRVAGRALIASARYRPGVYPGELTLFTPTRRDPGLPSPQSVWRRHARAIRIVDTTGDHLSMLSAAHAPSAAAALSSCLTQPS